MSLSKYYEENKSKVISRIPKHSICGLVVDMQDYFLKNISQNDLDIMIPAQIELIRYFATNSIPVIASEEPSLTATNSKIIKEFEKLHRYEIVYAKNNSAFDNTRLNNILSDWNIDNLIVMGVNASLCVKDTA